MVMFITEEHQADAPFVLHRFYKDEIMDLMFCYYTIRVKRQGL